MAKSKKEIIEEIQSYITKCGGGFAKWYVGIAADPKERLFDDHSVDKEKDAWIYCTASSSKVARKIEKHFLDEGADGGTGGGSEDTKSVYAYKISSRTDEDG